MKSKGYKINSESGNEKAVLYFGFDSQHGNHIHVSNQSNVPSVDSQDEEPEKDDFVDTEDGNDVPFWDIRGKLKQKGKEITQKIVDYIKNVDFLDKLD